jgi:transcription-repair coupling factor (superfamily II helicase)
LRSGAPKASAASLPVAATDSCADILAWVGTSCPEAMAAVSEDGPARVWTDVTSAAQAFLAAAVIRAARPSPARTWIVVPDLRTQENVHSDLATWLGPSRLCFFPQMDAASAVDDLLPDPELVSERLAILHRLAAPGPDDRALPPVLVVVADSLNEDVPRTSTLLSQELRLRTGATHRLEDLAATLEEAGYDRVPVVAERGQFAIRGGLLDVFSWQAVAPVRAEFFDREVESIRTFDVNQQTSVARQNEAVVLLVRPGEERQFVKLRSLIGEADLVLGLDVREEPAARLCLCDGADGADGGGVTLEPRAALGLTALPHPLGVYATGDFILQEARREAFRRQVAEWQDAGWRVAMFFNTEGEIERFREIMPEVAERLDCRLGQLNHGFTVPAARLAILADAEVFGRYQHTRARRLFARENRELGRRRLLDFRELDEGELVVHQDYGVAKFTGLLRPQGDAGDEVMVLEFADKARIHVSLEHAHLVSRYVGTGKKKPDLSKLGDERWAKTRKLAEKSIFDYAARLLSVQAERETRGRPAHQADSKWQWEFENSFVFKETPDQLRAITEAKRDMESGRPMDRLICGDVGFGKTEVAIRAAFKCVMGGRQAVVLAPTTVLAEQHWRTLRERMSDYPVRVDLLCRWRSKKEQTATVQGLADGSVDIVVGTHRLLGKDVVYKNLGLVVVDEEQRFGVAHKEKFKQLFRLVDVMTLSATPIPRTLYMALMGARDMSTIETPPPNRVPVQTHICPYDERVIRDAIQRELKRGGQVFFLHNRVGDIELIASKLRDLCPGAKVDIGHGQMDEEDLEDAMKRFVEGQTDVFVCTTIIESGIDIPNANTIIIDRADRFGLADLYQLRGRVGRAGHQAHAYLMLPREMLTTGDARKRVNAIRQYSQLGAGLKIAMRDLEIRGAGNLLGTQQSGHIFNIGFELYCNLLKRAVARVKGDQPGLRNPVSFRSDFLVTSPAEWKPERADLGHAPCYIPENYLPDARLRIAAYKEVAELGSPAALAALRDAWRDRFGPIPPPAECLLRLAQLKLAAANTGVTAIEIKQGKLMLTRRDAYILINGKFPRLTHPDGLERLVEAADWVRKV